MSRLEKGCAFTSVAAVVLVCGCSSIHSVESPRDASTAEGLTYFMPKKDFLVTVTVKKDDTSIAFSTTAAYPDFTKRYVLRYGENPFGKNTLDVGISEAGLLSGSSTSVTESSVADVFKGLAQLAGTMTGAHTLAPQKEKPEPCKAEGTYTFVYSELGTQEPCGIKIAIEPIGEPPSVGHQRAAGNEQSGLFYRQNLPYRMRTTEGSVHTEGIVYSPSRSATYFVPISKTFFTNNSAVFTFVDGVPTKYKEEAQGEVVGLLKLPADVISAYFAAVGAVFDNFKNRDTKQADALATSLKLELAKQKYDACMAALKAGQDARVKELNCGQ